MSILLFTLILITTKFLFASSLVLDVVYGKDDLAQPNYGPVYSQITSIEPINFNSIQCTCQYPCRCSNLYSRSSISNSPLVPTQDKTQYESVDYTHPHLNTEPGVQRSERQIFRPYYSLDNSLINSHEPRKRTFYRCTRSIPNFSNHQHRNIYNQIKANHDRRARSFFQRERDSRSSMELSRTRTSSAMATQSTLATLNTFNNVR